MKKEIKKQDDSSSCGYIFRRFRRVKGSKAKGEERFLDAWEYGYKAWKIPVRKC